MATPCRSIKLFFSYTLHGTDMNTHVLECIKEQFFRLPQYETYIDYLDNPLPSDYVRKNCRVELNESTITNKFQRQVKERLLSADVVCLLHSEQFDTSIWVQEELQLLKVEKKKHTKILKTEWETFVGLPQEQLLTSALIQKIQSSL